VLHEGAMLANEGDEQSLGAFEIGVRHGPAVEVRQ